MERHDVERPRHDTARQRLGLRDRDPRRQGLRGRQLRQCRRQGGCRLPRGLRRRQLEAVLQHDGETGVRRRLPGARAPVVGSTLYVGGTFQNANGDKRADYLIGCNLATGTPSLTVDTDGDFTGAVYDLTATSDGTLYAGGTFTNLDGVATADGVASYKGAWHGLGTTPIGGIVRGLHARGMDVYISSDGVNIGGIAQADHLVKWNGSAYSAVGANAAGTNGYFPATTYINALTTSGSLLFAAGSWQNATGSPATSLRRSTAAAGSRSARTAPAAGRGSAIPRRWRSRAALRRRRVHRRRRRQEGQLRRVAVAPAPDAEIGISGELRRQRRLQHDGAGQTKTTDCTGPASTSRS